MPDSFHTSTLTSLPQARPLGIAALVAGVLVAGCGGSSSSPTVPRLGATGTSGSAAHTDGGTGNSAPSSPAALSSAAIAYSKCMRSNGVPNFPDPNPGGGFSFHASPGLILSPAFKSAQAKCQKLMSGGGPPGPGSSTHPSAQTLARMVNVSRCMRQHGVSAFPDPRTSVPPNPFHGGVGVISDIEEVIFIFPSTINQQSPAFTQAAGACGFPLHNH